MPRTLLALLLAGCASAPQRKAPPPPPEWVRSSPRSDDAKVWAVGLSGPTLVPADGLRYAADDARGKLALQLHDHLEQITQRTETRAGLEGYELDKAATDALLQNSRIEATWVDEAGQVGDQGSTFALAVLDRAGSGEVARAALPAAAGPAWLDRLPSAAGRLFAVGYSGPTFEPAAARDAAAEVAMDNLASSLRAHVQAYSLAIEDGAGADVEDYARTDDPDAALRDRVHQGARVEAVWVDGAGVRSGDEKGGVWALVSIAVKSTRGAAQAVPNEDLGPALDSRGDVKPAP